MCVCVCDSSNTTNKCKTTTATTITKKKYRRKLMWTIRKDIWSKFNGKAMINNHVNVKYNNNNNNSNDDECKNEESMKRISMWTGGGNLK